MYLWRKLMMWRNFLFIHLLIIIFNSEVLHCKSQSTARDVNRNLKPPPALYITRVSRGPLPSSQLMNSINNINNNNNVMEDSDKSNSNDLDFPSVNFLKSPVYQMRLRQPNRFSQFHERSSPSFHYTDDEVDQPFFESYRSVQGRHGDTREGNDNNARNGDDSSGWKSNTDDNLQDEEEQEIEEPTFTPFISARALSNMGKFFEHLQENVLAIQQEQEEEKQQQLLKQQQVGPLERRRMLGGNSMTDAQSEFSHFRNNGLLLESNADTSSSGFPSSSSSTTAESSSESDSSKTLTWPPPASRFFRNPSPTFLTSNSNNNGGGARASRLLTKMQTFIEPQVEHEKRLRNKYNPSWMWTNMGLG